MSQSVLQYLPTALAAVVIVWLITRMFAKRMKWLNPRRTLGAMGLAFLAVTAYFSVVVVETGMVGVVRTFGEVKPQVMREGIHFANPFNRYQMMSIRRQVVDLGPARSAAPLPTADKTKKPEQQLKPIQRKPNVALSLDRTPLEVDVAFPVQLKPEFAWRVFQVIGPRYQERLLIPAARVAIRDSFAKFEWKDAVTTGRQTLTETIDRTYAEIVIENLMRHRFSEEEARNTFELLPVQVRKILPPKRILSAISERLAAEEDLQRQGILTKIAREEADRRANEGLGVKRLFESLPAGFTAEQINNVLIALAEKQRADVLMRAVENGLVRVIVLDGNSGGSGAGVSVPLPAN